MIFIVIYNLLLVLASAAKPNTSEFYPNEYVLQTPDLLFLYWKHDNSQITFELHAKNTQWILLGINSSDYADVVIAWIKSNQQIGHFSDRKLTGSTKENYRTTIDNKTDWFPLELVRKDEYLVLKFSRRIKICDLFNEDLDIQFGTSNNLIYSYGSSFTNNDIKFDSNLNVLNIDLLKQTSGPFVCDETKPVEFTSVPTAYYANQFDLVQGEYRFYWNFTDQILIGEIHCKTQGWVGFGFSPNGNMDNSDVAIGWISGSNIHFTVMFLTIHFSL